MQTTENGNQIDMGMLNGLEARYGAIYSSGNFSNDPIAQARDQQVRAAYQNNRNLINQWDAAADREINKFLFFSIGAPALLAAGATAAPAAGAYTLSLLGMSVSGFTGSAAYYGTSFATGGATGGVFEFSKNRVFGLQDTAGGYAGAILGGGFGATGLPLLGEEAPLVLNKIALGVVAGAGGDFVGQEVDVRPGSRPNLDGRSILVSGLIGGTAGGASSLEVRVNGLNAGSNSDLAIYRGLQTRIGSGNIGQFQLRYGVQGGAAQWVLGIGQAGASSVYLGIYQDMHR